MTTIYRPNGRTQEVVTAEVLTSEIETARKHLAAAIELKGADYVYKASPKNDSVETCLYLDYARVECHMDDDGYEETRYIDPVCPSCLIGHVLAAMEIPYEQITKHEGENAYEATEGVFHSEIVRTALLKAQSKQDGGGTWGEAVEEFEAYINEHTVKTDA